MSKPIPDPIKITMTVKEAAKNHMLIDALMRAAEIDPDLNIDIPMMKRIKIALEMPLKRAGCVLDEEGWKV